MEIVHQFGIEWKLLLVQAINFLLFLFIFWRFVYKRLFSFLDERKKTIAQSLKDAERAKAEAAKAEDAREKDRQASRREAAKILAEAKSAAKEEGAKILAEAKQGAEQLGAKQKAQLASEQAKLRTELRGELAALTVETTRKVLSDVVTKQDQEKMVAEATKHLRKTGAGRGQ